MDKPDQQRFDGRSGASKGGCVRTAGPGGTVCGCTRAPTDAVARHDRTGADPRRRRRRHHRGRGGDRRPASDPGRCRWGRRAGRPGSRPAPAPAGALDRRGPARAVRGRGRRDGDPGRRRLDVAGVLRARPRLPGARPHVGLRRHARVASWRAAREAGGGRRHRDDRTTARVDPAHPTRAGSPAGRLRRHRPGQRPRPGPRAPPRPARAGRRPAPVDDRDPRRRGRRRTLVPGRRRGDRCHRRAARNERRRLRRSGVVPAGAGARPPPARAGRRHPGRAPAPSGLVAPGAGVQAAGRGARRPGHAGRPAPRLRGAGASRPGRDGRRAGPPAADRRARPGGDGAVVPHPEGAVGGSPGHDVLGRHLGSDRAGREAAAPHPPRRTPTAGVGAAAQDALRRRGAGRHPAGQRPRRAPTSRR